MVWLALDGRACCVLVMKLNVKTENKCSIRFGLTQNLARSSELENTYLFQRNLIFRFPMSTGMLLYGQSEKTFR